MYVDHCIRIFLLHVCFSSKGTLFLRLLPYHMIHRAGRIKRERVGQKREGESIKKNSKASLDVSAFEEKTSANNLLLVRLATCSSVQVFSLSVRFCQSGYFLRNLTMTHVFLCGYLSLFPSLPRGGSGQSLFLFTNCLGSFTSFRLGRMASRGFLLLLWISLAMTMEIPTKCERDSDCSEVDYCLSSMCERCIPCQEILHRQPPPSQNGRNVCAKTEDDCGVCMPGYQSEDLVGQRRSMKCFPTSFIDERPNDTGATVPTLGVAMTSIFVALMITVMAAGSCLVYVKHRQLTTETSGREREENKKLVDRLPPPYELPDESGEICGPVHVSQRNFALVAAPEYLNQATPINHFHHPKPKVDSDVEEDHGILNGPEPQPVFEDGNGSTETIPSLWEPSSANDLQMESVSEPDLFRPTTQSQELRSLIRCQSLELPPIRPVYNRVLSATISDPTLPTDNGRRSSGGESYAHRHVRLSMHRLAISQVTEEMRQGENAPSCSTLPGGDCDDDCEPSEPQSFVFDDSQVSTTDVSYESNFLTTSLLSFTGSLYGRPFSSSTPTANEAGSRDSGFFDQSRRRPATDEAGFGVTLFIKRPREFE